MSATRAGTVYLAGNLASAGVPFLLLPLLTRLLSPAEYGVVVNFMLLTAAASAFAGLGLHGALGVAWFREQPGDLTRLAGTAIVVATASSLLVALVLCCIVIVLGPQQFGFGPGVAALAAVAAGANVLLQCRLVLWQSAQRPWPNALTQLIGSALNVALSLIGVMILGWGSRGRIAGVVGAAVLMAVAAVSHLAIAGLLRFKLRRADVWILVAFGVPLIPHAVAGVMLSNADRFVVSARLGTGSLGTYGAAAQMGALMAVIADAFVKALNPWLYARLQSGDPQQALRVVGAIYLAVPGFLGLSLVVGAGLILVGPFILGAEFRDALGLIPWFMLGGAFSGMYLAVSGLYFFHSRTAMLSLVSFPSALLGVVATMALVGTYGMLGAAMGYAITQGVLAVAAWVVARNAFALPWSQPAAALSAWRHGARPSRVEH